MNHVPHPLHFSVSPIKGRHFETIDVVEAESQAVLNIFTEHNLQDAIRKWRKPWKL
jgi:hypothetical protein